MPHLDQIFAGCYHLARKRYELETDYDTDASLVSYATKILIVDPKRVKDANPENLQAALDGLDRSGASIYTTASADEIDTFPMISAGNKARFRRDGYVLIVGIPHDLRRTKRGRRQLSAAEREIGNSLRIWTFALIPEIAKQIQGETRAKVVTDQTYDLLRDKAPSLLRLAASSAAGKGIAESSHGSAGDGGDLVGFIEALRAEGRKLPMQFPGERALRKGSDLRDKAAAISRDFKKR